MNTRDAFLKQLSESKLETITIHDVTKIILKILKVDDNIQIILDEINKEKLLFESEGDKLMTNIFTSSYYWVSYIHARKHENVKNMEIHKKKSYELWNQIVNDLN